MGGILESLLVPRALSWLIPVPLEYVATHVRADVEGSTSEQTTRTCPACGGSSNIRWERGRCPLCRRAPWADGRLIYPLPTNWDNLTWDFSLRGFPASLVFQSLNTPAPSVSLLYKPRCPWIGPVLFRILIASGARVSRTLFSTGQVGCSSLVTLSPERRSEIAIMARSAFGSLVCSDFELPGMHTNQCLLDRSFAKSSKSCVIIGPAVHPVSGVLRIYLATWIGNAAPSSLRASTLRTLEYIAAQFGAELVHPIEDDAEV